MLITLLAWIYISLLCHSWGIAFIKGLSSISGNQQPTQYGFSITCFIGLGAIAGIAQIISLFTGLSSISIQLLFFLPAVYVLFFFEKPDLLIQFRAFVKSMNLAILFLLISCLVMVLVMGVYSIIHPDTIAYHAQLIKWAERYPAIPGLVHVNYLYGLQNNWFLLCGLFSFSFTGTNALTFINTTVLVWLLIFLTQKISETIKKPGCGYLSLLWFLLLLINIWTYTQIRLTATSGSPDFIATLYILLVFYLFTQYDNFSNETQLIIVYLCLFTFTIKLSSIPLLLLALYLQFSFNRIKKISGAFMGALIIVPFLIRNVITSGYLFFPIAFPDIIHTDWKYDIRNLDYINHYILQFARTRNNITATDKPFFYWVWEWWHYLYFVDKLVIAFQFFTAILFAFNYKKIIAENKLKRNLIFFSLAGILFWFLKAPDPRFGAGFLLVFPALVLYSPPFIQKIAGLFSQERIVIFMCLLLGIAVCSYSAYRFINYFKTPALVSPEGLVQPYQSFYYNEIKTSIPLPGAGNKNVIIVTGNAHTRQFNFRGQTAEQGFKEKDAK